MGTAPQTAFSLSNEVRVGHVATPSQSLQSLQHKRASCRAAGHQPPLGLSGLIRNRAGLLKTFFQGCVGRFRKQNLRRPFIAAKRATWEGLLAAYETNSVTVDRDAIGQQQRAHFVPQSLVTRNHLQQL